MRRQLRRQKFDCLIQYAATEGEYLKALREFSPDLILSDYKFPLHSGLFSLKMAREVCPAVPFIFVSGVLEDDLAGELLKQGARAYVSKSRLEQLVTTVQSALLEPNVQKQPTHPMPNGASSNSLPAQL
ncbi:MAG: hypothetical protein DME24_13100 [Verrucomicrobia bacterium]|nr:MAG: hypothetical protein DME24_13100 [Verrucomicrobiota bacterium]